MNSNTLPAGRVRRLLRAAARNRILVIGDVMLDQFIWGTVTRISPEAPVPVVDFKRESLMPGGAANVARNLTSLGGQAELFGVVGNDPEAKRLRSLLRRHSIGCAGLHSSESRPTSVKTRIVAHQQQVVRIDRESRSPVADATARRLLQAIESQLPGAAGVIVGDYGKGMVTQGVLNQLKLWCRQRAIWLSVDPKPVHHLDLTGLSLLTPNRRETFELAGVADDTRTSDPQRDRNLRLAADRLLAELRPAVLLVTLGELGMLLCMRGRKPHHIPTVAQEVFDVSGAGDTVIATFTLAVAAGASPLEAALLANHAAGIVVGKVGTATVTAEELLRNLDHQKLGAEPPRGRVRSA